jgi:hypothetical protein
MDGFGFHGFSPGLFRFLNSLAQNKDRDWLGRNRKYYEANVLTPIKSFAGEIGSALRVLNGKLEPLPRVGSAINKLNNSLRTQSTRSIHRAFIYATFPRKGAGRTSEAALYAAFNGRGVVVGFDPGSGNRPSGSVQERIRQNLRLFQRYLDERRIPNRYSELAGGGNAQVTRWPLPKSARRWVALESFTVGEYFDCADPILYSQAFRERVIGIMLDLYPLWLFAVSQNLRADFETYRENARLLARPSSMSAGAGD